MTRRRSQHDKIRETGFSLVELLVTVAVIGILSSITISISGNEWRRERINTVAIDLAGWLEVVRNNALKQTSTTSSAGGCTITFSALTSQAAGSSLATVTPASCTSQTTFRIPAVSGNDLYSTAISNGSGASSDQIIFTPRGTAMNSAAIDLKLRIDGTSSLRCVRVSQNLGLVSIGSNESASSAISDATCNSFSIF